MADDYYAVLGVDRRASAEEIKKAYRRLTLELHPDRRPGEADAAERFRKINEAYDTLGDPAKRARYDTTSRLQQLDITKGFDGQSARDLLSNVFGDVFRSRRRDRRRGRDLRYTLTVDLEQAVLGSTHEIEFDAPGPCSTCNGSGTRPGGAPPSTCTVCGGRGEIKGDGLFAPWTRCGRCDGTGMLQVEACEVCRGSGRRKQTRTFTVTLPPGTEAGAQKILEGLGEPGRYGGEAGDLRVTVNVRPHAWLERRGDEIHTEVHCSITEAAIGASVPVLTVDGVVKVDLPAGVRSGTKLRLRGKGVPFGKEQRRRGAATRGDQLVNVVVETPQAASDEMRAALRRLEELSEREQALPRRAKQRQSVS
jgi:molecular chaperone DnaJ